MLPDVDDEFLERSREFETKLVLEVESRFCEKSVALAG